MAKADHGRLIALDWMRGIVMVLMTVDHASHVFNGAGISPDSYLFGAIGEDLSPDGSPWAFLTRWVTHLCAPTFLFLAGASVALSAAARERRGVRAWRVDVHLILRGLLLVLLEGWMFAAWGMQTIQVLYAIGVSLAAMAFLRHLPTWLTVGAAGVFLVLGEAAVVAAGLKPQPLGVMDPPGPWTTAWLLPRFEELAEAPNWLGLPLFPFRVFTYPAAGWMAILVLGHGFGRWLIGARGTVGFGRRAARFCAGWGAAFLVAFVILRSAGDYGNYWLDRTDDSWLRWLQVSKYPPSLAFTLLELGIAGLLLAPLWLLQGTRLGALRSDPVTVLGQTALLYYLLHAHLLRLAGLWGFGIPLMDVGPYGPASAWIGAAGCVLALWPLCAGYRGWRGSRR